MYVKSQPTANVLLHAGVGRVWLDKLVQRQCIRSAVRCLYRYITPPSLFVCVRE